MEELNVITKSKQLAILTYKFCNKYLPDKEKFGLWSQMTRCSVSVVSNIAEGKQRGNKEFMQFIKVSRGSLLELKIQLEILNEIYENNETERTDILNLIDDIGKMTFGLLQKIRDDVEVLK
jgi:four helix bundle protein